VIEVLGSPAPKGSGRAILIGGKAQHVPSGSNVNARAIKSWDSAVRAAAALAVGSVDAPPFVDVALRVTMIWRLSRPAGHYASGKNAGQLKPRAPEWPIKKPDGSKLLRATEDSLTGIVWDDDARVVEWFLRKSYASPGNEGARIIVEAIA
jgi:Holliday junction resolvase RusA-like endonuclease